MKTKRKSNESQEREKSNELTKNRIFVNDIFEDLCDLRLSLICFKNFDRLLAPFFLNEIETKSLPKPSIQTLGNLSNQKSKKKPTNIKRELKKATSNKFTQILNKFPQQIPNGISNKFKSLQKIRNTLVHNAGVSTFQDLIDFQSIPFDKYYIYR